jgi:hypothetical protein
MIPSIYVNNLLFMSLWFMTVDKHEESIIRHRTENELSEAYYTHFLEFIQTITITTIKLLLHGKGNMKNSKNRKIARTSLDINGYRQSASWLFSARGISPVSCLCCHPSSYFFLSFKEDLNA